MIEKRSFGKTKVGETTLYILENKNGAKITVSDYGAILVSVLVPDVDGKLIDVVLGYDTAGEYEASDKWFGATVGRVANRISDATFTLNGKTYGLTPNDNMNTLHGGRDFYNNRMWEVKDIDEGDVYTSITFAIISEDGDQGFPGKVDISVTYRWNNDNSLDLIYNAKADKDTPLNLTNHSYFNLDGHNSGNILDEEVWINAEVFAKTDEFSIPDGGFVPVEDTPMDFTERKQIGKDINADYIALKYGNGYDHSYELLNEGYEEVASLYAAKTGITMEVYTDMPAMQLYSGNFLVNEKGKSGAIYGKRGGICFETQYTPNAINVPEFKSCVLLKGEDFTSRTTYKFITE
ncbi:MAG: galactose mutarotase [Lachnospiraceae bacterium]|jgi:aldose 1-epimerase|nr:galactose mutarotase [Lachnospiraceae bacterium]